MSNVIQFVPRDETILRRATAALVKDLTLRGYRHSLIMIRVAHLQQTIAMKQLLDRAKIRAAHLHWDGCK